MDSSSNNIVQTKPKKSRKPKNASSRMYVNVNRAQKTYRDKYKIETDKALKKFKADMGKPEEYELTDQEWKVFFTTILIPLDKEREVKMINMFRDDRPRLNNLLILHNAKAGENLAEVYFKKYQKSCPTKWYDLDDFKQLAAEGLAIAAKKFDLNYKNRFLTYATWWILNRVRKPYQEKGAMLTHTSLNAPADPEDDLNNATVEDVLNPDMISSAWDVPGASPDFIDPRFALDKMNVDENQDLFQTLKNMKGNALDCIDEKKARMMLDYLVSIVEKNENSYDNKQIFLYLFKKTFIKYSSINPDSSSRLTTYISEAAKSKADLLKRLHMTERQYEAACKRLTRGGYDGI